MSVPEAQINVWQDALAIRALQEPLPSAALEAAPKNLLGVEDDVAAVRAFLAEYAGQPATFRSYVKEVERFLLWLTLVRRTSLARLTRADMTAFAEFLADPQPRAQWCGPKRGRLAPRFSAQWRPFVGPLSSQAQHSTLIVLNVLLKYLVLAQYIPANPLALMRRQAMRDVKSLSRAAHVGERVLSDRQWQAVTDSLAPPGGQAEAPISERFVRERARERFVVASLYFLALRVGELTTHTMGDFRLRRGRWSFFVLGKGSKPAEIPVNDALLMELRSYREALGMSALPQAAENTPLIGKMEAPQHPLTARRVHQILQALFARAADSLSRQDPEAAEHLRTASPHWLRHTSLTRQIEAGLSLQEVRANARHSKFDTTLLYVHTERDARHDAMQAHSWQSREPQKDDA